MRKVRLGGLAGWVDPAPECRSLYYASTGGQQYDVERRAACMAAVALVEDAIPGPVLRAINLESFQFINSEKQDVHNLVMVVAEYMSTVKKVSFRLPERLESDKKVFEAARRSDTSKTLG